MKRYNYLKTALTCLVNLNISIYILVFSTSLNLTIFTDVPILSVVTKGDNLEEATISNLDLRQYDLGLKREQFFIRMSSKCRSVPRQQVFILGNYRCEMDHVLDQPAFEIRPCAARDSAFLQIWREILKAAGSLEEARTFKETSNERRRAVSESVKGNTPYQHNSCIPSFRLRINSYS